MQTRVLNGAVKSTFIICLFLIVITWSQTSAQNGQVGITPPPAPSQTATADIDAARRLSQQGKNTEALARLQALAAQNPGLPGLSHELGIAYYKSGDYAKAIDTLRKATEEDPKDSEAIQLLGLSNYLAGRPAEAIPLLEKVQGWYPRANVDASYILGICYIQAKDYPKARQSFARMF